MIRDFLQTVAAEEAAGGRKRREREALERSFEKFSFKVGKRDWKRADFMPGDFLDTHVLVYAYDPTDRRKQEVAQGLLKRALGGEMTLSAQVSAEFAATLFHKLSPPAPPESVKAVLDALGPIRLLPTDGDMVLRAVEARAAYGLHFYDALVVAAAERAGCDRIWSEDLSAGQKYFGVTVRNPFAGA